MQYGLLTWIAAIIILVFGLAHKPKSVKVPTKLDENVTTVYKTKLVSTEP
jgi:hypothetical protein